MGKRCNIKLERIERNNGSTGDNDREFLLQLTQALLLALKERGILTKLQCDYALERCAQCR